MKGCLFCKFVDERSNIKVIWEDNDFIAFLDQFPAKPGHTLLVPKKHVNYVFDLKEPMYSKLFRAASKLSKPLRKAMKTKRVVLDVEGFMIPHTHVHLIPSNEGAAICCHSRGASKPEKLSEVQRKIDFEIRKAKLK